MACIAQIALLNSRITSYNAIRATLISNNAPTTEIDEKILNDTNLLNTFNQQLTNQQNLAQNNIDCANIKNDLITHLGVEFTNRVHTSIVCATVHDNCPCICCKYAYYVSKGLTNDQIKLII